MANRSYTTEEIVRLGREIYEREVRAKVEASREGEFVDATTGSWEVDGDDVAASDRVLAKNPDAVIYFARVEAPRRLPARLPLGRTVAMRGSVGVHGRVVLDDMCAARVLRHGEERPVRALVADATPLLGMALPGGNELRVECLGGGEVTVEELSSG